ncbi:MAG: transglutaminase-like cysteine peptidase [Gammaproteobacteria bacterium]|nr:transglutaminase-like cysteine peptidase [Gammaproteobacteria bacterium]
MSLSLPRRLCLLAACLAIGLGTPPGRAGDEAALAWLRAEYGARAEARYLALQARLAQASDLPEADRLALVNEAYNRAFAFRDDQAIWHKADFWATPLQALGQGAGDCEDYSLAKYFALTRLGVPKEKLRLTYVRARLGSPDSTLFQAHMVLTYYATPGAMPLVLDNLIDEIRPAAHRPDLTPVYSFNHDGVWAGSGGAKPPDGPVARLSRWQELLGRMRAQGLEPIPQSSAGAEPAKGKTP